MLKFGTQTRGLTAYLLTQEEKIKLYPVKGEFLDQHFPRLFLLHMYLTWALYIMHRYCCCLRTIRSVNLPISASDLYKRYWRRVVEVYNSVISTPALLFFLVLISNKGMPGFEEFVCTDSTDQVTDSSPLYGLDCEMVRCSIWSATITPLILQSSCIVKYCFKQSGTVMPTIIIIREMWKAPWQVINTLLWRFDGFSKMDFLQKKQCLC